MGIYTLVVDQCMYGLGFPGNLNLEKNERILKQKIFITNAPAFRALHITCNKQHYHVHAVGHVKVNNVYVKRSKAAGNYPNALSFRMVSLLLDHHCGR